MLQVVLAKNLAFMSEPRAVMEIMQILSLPPRLEQILLLQVSRTAVARIDTEQTAFAYWPNAPVQPPGPPGATGPLGKPTWRPRSAATTRSAQGFRLSLLPLVAAPTRSASSFS